VLVGYARVSTFEQDTALQLDALRNAGVRKIYQDKASGVGDRVQLQLAIDDLTDGNILVVWKLDRIARSLSDLLGIIARVKSAGASIKSLTEPIDTSNPIGNFTVQVLGAVAELERSIIIQRSVAGIAAARARGVQWGRRPLLSIEEQNEVVRLAELGMPIADIARAYGISRPLVYKLMQSSNKKPTC